MKGRELKRDRGEERRRGGGGEEAWSGSSGQIDTEVEEEEWDAALQGFQIE